MSSAEIRVWDYRAVLERERAETMAAISRVLDSGTLILGEHVAAFEQAFASYCRTHHGVGVNSGTDALFLGLLALGVGPGHEVITVANTAVPTVSAIVATGATPRFVDIEADTYLMDTSALEEAISPSTSCILPVHLYGQCVDMTALGEVASRHRVSVLEDCAQAHGARHHDEPAGSFGAVSAYSFYPTKILGGYGDGGMALTSSPDVEARLRRLRFYGMSGTYYSEEHGYNSRLDELHAAVLLSKLPHLDDYVAERRRIADRYDDALASTSLTLPTSKPDNKHAYYLYVVRHPERDAILEALRAASITLNISYPWPIHTMPAYSDLGYASGDLPITEHAAREIFSLPMYPGLPTAAQDRVIEVLTELAP